MICVVGVAWRQASTTIHIERNVCIHIIINDRVILMTITGRTWYDVAPNTGESERSALIHTNANSVRVLCALKRFRLVRVIIAFKLSLLLLMLAIMTDDNSNGGGIMNSTIDDDVAKFYSPHIQESFENHTVTHTLLFYTVYHFGWTLFSAAAAAAFSLLF